MYSYFTKSRYILMTLLYNNFLTFRHLYVWWVHLRLDDIGILVWLSAETRTSSPNRSEMFWIPPTHSPVNTNPSEMLWFPPTHSAVNTNRSEMLWFPPTHSPVNINRSEMLWFPPTHSPVNTLRTGDADLRFYITTVQDGWRKSAFLTRFFFPCTIHLIMQFIEPLSEWSC